MSLKKLIKSRRSISNFTNKKISKKLIDEIIQLSGETPSSCNTQPWFYLVFDSEKSKNKLNSYIDKGYKLTEKELIKKYKVMGNIYVKLLKFFSNYGKFDEAPVLILLFARPYDTPLFSQAIKFAKHKEIKTIADDSVKTSSAMSMQNLLLIAHEKGLGTRVKDGIKFLMNHEALKNELYKEFKVPKNYFMISGIQIGYPTKKALERKAPPRLPIEKIRRYI